MTHDFTRVIRDAGRELGLDDPLPPVPSRERCDAATRPPFIEWGPFFQRESAGAEYLPGADDVLALGRGHALYGPHKSMKSLLCLYLAATMATRGAVVVYLDYENSEDDVRERLEAMGYGPESDLSNLLYWQFPARPPLDTAEGGRALMGVLDDVQADHPGQHVAVFIDTYSRAVAGDENESGTTRAFYRYTGMGFKARGITWVRLDHSGKDTEKGQRGSSAKGDDVDVVWRIQATDNGLRLRRDVARMAWVPEHVGFRITEDPLAFVRHEGDWPTGTGEAANMLDRLGLPLDASTRTAQEALRGIGEGRRRELVGAALRWRRSHAADAFRTSETTGTTPGTTPGTTTPGTAPGTTPAASDSETGTSPGTTGNH